MDPIGNIYPVDENILATQPDEVTQEDIARLDEFLSRRAERDEERREKYLEKYGIQVWDSRSKGPYRKERVMGIEGIENLGAHSDPGDEHREVEPLGDPEPVTTDTSAEPPEVDARPGEPDYPGTEAPDTTPPGGDNPIPAPDTTPPLPEEPVQESNPPEGWQSSGANTPE